MRWAAILAFTTLPAFCESVTVYSEFARIDANGVAAGHPREILSPAIVRNGFTSFQIVAEVRKGTPYALYVGQNPEQLKITVYKRSGVRLERVELPFTGDETQVFWMDLWCALGAPVRRVKIEPQLELADRWIPYPMEVRVVDATVPDGGRSGAPLTWLQQRVCGSRAEMEAGPGDSFQARNAQQDALLAARIPQQKLAELAGDCKIPAENPEWYLKIRDYLFRVR